MDAKREDAPQRAADLWTHTAPAEGSATQGIMASMSKSRGPRGGVGSKRIESVRRSNSFDEASAPDVARLMDDLGLSRFLPLLLADEAADMDTLKFLEARDLEEMLLPRGARMKLLHALHQDLL